MKRTVPIIILLSLCAYTLASAGDPVSKRGTSAAPFLELGVGGRAMGMGQAFTALANDASTLYWNPAGMERLSSNTIGFNYMNWVADMKFVNAAMVIKAGSAGSFGVSITTLSTPEMLVRTVQEPEGLGLRFDAADMALGISYAKELTDRFSFGGTFKYIERRIWHMSANAIAADFGMLYSMPWDGVQLGISITNFGSKLQMQGVDLVKSIDIDPSMAGNNSAVMTQLRTKEWALPLQFRFGVSYDMLKTETNRFTVAADFLHPNDNNQSVNGGVEYCYNDMLMLRAGYQALFLQDAEEGLACGIGLKYEGVVFDFSYNTMEHLGYVDEFTVQLNF
jgi:hypothetical protein